MDRKFLSKSEERRVRAMVDNKQANSDCASVNGPHSVVRLVEESEVHKWMNRCHTADVEGLKAEAEKAELAEALKARGRE